ncbi:hypothetical protein PCYB_143620 [Plasmodium cynomolgi strain B]|uniref:Uncharacterized protein n=1 Tax=Plasmodium cynomolgi (strain B) TaxID=1120755 RepID=K6UYH6_PLACD|nr:hypothetical protein PCYB_143620 [Plasmodium cynomolgi strain B]GAB68934.1 hypothetical protein PCYB_143620 [Plasmodium cynomolgi strain B]
MILHRIRKAHFSMDVNVSNLLRKKAILFENVKRENCKKELILDYFDIKGVKLKKNDIHIMTNILCRPTGRIMILTDNMKKQNFNFDFGSLSKGREDLPLDEKRVSHESGEDSGDSPNSSNSNTANELEDATTCDIQGGDSSSVQLRGHNQVNAGRANGGTEEEVEAEEVEEEKEEEKKEEEYRCTTVWNKNLKNLFKECKIHLCDDFEIERFVEECERFLRFTEDIKRVARFENLDKIITIINIPSCYGRKELAQIIYDCARINVKLKNIIFRFKKNGIQSDCAYVLCDSVNDGNILVNKMQEYPVAKKYHLREFFGTSFLYASRSNLFLSSEKLDYVTIFSKYKIFTCGWHKDISIKEFESFLITLKIFPKKIIKIDHRSRGAARAAPQEHSAGNCAHQSDDQLDDQSDDQLDHHSEDHTDCKYQLSPVDPHHILISIDEADSATADADRTNDPHDANTSSFILFFENMRMTKKVFTKLERLKKKWKISASKNFYAYPKTPDIHFNDDEDYDDENEYEDSDLDEEIEY